jgi:hypothetical protein
VAAERSATQTSAEQFHPLRWPGGVYPLVRVAQSFKTSAARIVQAEGHESNVRSGAWKSYLTPPR